MLTWLQNASNPISKDLNLDNFFRVGWPWTPLQGNTINGPHLPQQKSTPLSLN